MTITIRENNKNLKLVKKYDDKTIKFCIESLNYFGVDEYKLGLIDILFLWNAPGRFYHNVDNHLMPLLKNIINHPYLDNKYDKMKLVIVALFHDIIYNKVDSDVDDSIKMFVDNLYVKTNEDNHIVQIIKNTKDHDSRGDKLSELFNEMDFEVLKGDYQSLLKYERNIFLEYQFSSYEKYKEERIKFLTKHRRFDRGSLPLLIEYVENYIPKIGVFAGSFNPFHKGHLNILEQAEKIFDKVIIIQLINDNKNNLDKLPENFLHRQTEYREGLLVDFVNEVEKYSDVTVVRGLRNNCDLIEENQLAFYLKEQKPDIKLSYLICDKEFEFISSSNLKILLNLDPKLADKYIIKNERTWNL